MRPDHRTGRRQGDLGRGVLASAAVLEARDPEVEELAELVRRDHHVLGLQVAVQDAGRVGMPERLEQSRRDRERLSERKRAFSEAVAEGFAIDVFHGEKGNAVDFPGLVERGDRRMLEARARGGLAEEPFPRVRRDRRGEDFDRRRPPEGEVAGEKDLAHAPGTQRLVDSVVREDAPDHRRSGAAYNPGKPQ